MEFPGLATPPPTVGLPQAPEGFAAAIGEASILHPFRPKLANPIPTCIRVHISVEPIWDSLMNHIVKDAVLPILKVEFPGFPTFPN